MRLSDLSGVLLVDDEPLVTIGLESTIDWGSLGCEIIATARGGAEALRIIDEQQPRLVITDIHMPGMDGLELIRASRSAGYDVEYIVLSVLNDFEHVRSALRLGAADYIVKSDVTPEVVARAVLQAKSRLQRHAAPTRAANLGDILLRMVSDDSWRAPDEIINDVRARFPAFRAIIVRIDNMHLIRERRNNDTLVPFYVAAGDLVRRSFGKNAVVAPAQGDRYFVLSAPESTEADPTRRTKTLAARFRDVLNATVSVGISGRCSDPALMGNAFRAASDALAPSFFHGPGYVGHAGARITQRPRAQGSEPMSPDTSAGFDRTLGTIAQHAARWDVEAIRKDVDGLRAMIVERRDLLSPQEARGAYVSALETILANGPAEYRSPASNDQRVFSAFVQATDVATIHAALLEHIEGIAQSADELLRYNSTRPVDRALRLIHQHFDTGISLQTIAQQVHVTPSYLSRSFRKRVGTKFTEYLAITRVERAKHLLISGTRRISEVAHQVGYDDPAYFSRVFRRITGVSPEEFARRSDNETSLHELDPRS